MLVITYVKSLAPPRAETPKNNNAIEESAATRAPLRYTAIRIEVIFSYLQALRATML